MSRQAPKGLQGACARCRPFASPQDAAIIVALLQGKQSPTVEFFGFDADPNTLAATWRVYFDFSAALTEHRAAYRAKGEV